MLGILSKGNIPNSHDYAWNFDCEVLKDLMEFLSSRRRLLGDGPRYFQQQTFQLIVLLVI